MSRPARYWTCQRVAKGVKCGHKQPARYRNCRACGKPRPARRRQAHMVALDLPYEEYVLLNGGEHCGICGRPPTGRRLDRDHDHRTGQPRGLLCWNCNKLLTTRIANLEWMQRAVAYLERTV